MTPIILDKTLKESQDCNDFISYYNKNYTKPFGKTNTIDINNRLISENISVSQVTPNDKLNQSIFITNVNPKNISKQFIIPNLKRLNNSYVIVDNDKENNEQYEKLFTENKYHVIKYNPNDIDGSCNFNPINYISNNKDISLFLDSFFYVTRDLDVDIFESKNERIVLATILKDILLESEEKIDPLDLIAKIKNHPQQKESENIIKRIIMLYNNSLSLFLDNKKEDILDLSKKDFAIIIETKENDKNMIQTILTRQLLNMNIENNVFVDFYINDDSVINNIQDWDYVLSTNRNKNKIFNIISSDTNTLSIDITEKLLHFAGIKVFYKLSESYTEKRYIEQVLQSESFRRYSNSNEIDRFDKLDSKECLIVFNNKFLIKDKMII